MEGGVLLSDLLATFALGTAAGDLTATTFHLGCRTSGIVFAVTIAVPAVAYVITRPVKASFAGWMRVSRAHGGLSSGTGLVTLAVLGVIAVLGGALSARDRTARHGAPSILGELPHEQLKEDTSNA